MVFTTGIIFDDGYSAPKNGWHGPAGTESVNAFETARMRNL
jgi:hypothetical protein